MVRMVLIMMFVVLITSCSSFSPEARHEAFKAVYGDQVGHHADDPDHSWLVRYPTYVIGSRVLSNGNSEIEYEAGTSVRRCRVFYEIDANSRIIVGWRFEGSEHNCRWAPS